MSLCTRALVTFSRTWRGTEPGRQRRADWRGSGRRFAALRAPRFACPALGRFAHPFRKAKQRSQAPGLRAVHCGALGLGLCPPRWRQPRQPGTGTAAEAVPWAASSAGPVLRERRLWLCRPKDTHGVSVCVSSAPPLLKINPGCNAELQFFSCCLRKGIGSSSYRELFAKCAAVRYHSFQLKTILTFVE